MIGVILSKRRQEFIRFAAANLADYREIFDPTDTELLSSLDMIYSDAPTDSVGAFFVKCFETEPLEETFKDYILGPPPQLQKSFGGCLFCFDHFQRYLLKGFVPVSMAAVLPEESKPQETPQVTAVEHIQVNKLTEHEVVETFSTELPDTLEVEPPPPPPPPQPQFEPTYQPAQPTVYSPPSPQSSSPAFFAPSEEPLMPTSFFGNQPAPYPIQPAASGSVAVRGRAISGSVRPRGLKQRNMQFQVPVITVSSITDKTGVSSISYLLSQVLAEQHPTAKVLYIDLNIGNPNYLAGALGINPDTDAALTKIASLSQDEFISNIALLTEAASLGRSSISVITLGQASFMQKKAIANANFEQLLVSLSNCFDLIVVDLGKIQCTLNYQLNLLNSHVARHLILADGSDSRLVKAFTANALELPRSFEIVVNKYSPQAGIFTINQVLHMQPIATIGLHRNVDAFVTGRLAFEGTALYNELTKLGGIL